MPKEIEGDTLYLFLCKKCKIEFEKWLKMGTADLVKKCPNCNGKSILRIFTSMGWSNFIESAKTFGKASEINAKRVGKEGIDAINQSDKVMKARLEQDKNKDIFDFQD